MDLSFCRRPLLHRSFCVSMKLLYREVRFQPLGWLGLQPRATRRRELCDRMSSIEREELHRMVVVCLEVVFSLSNLPKAGIIHRRAECRAGESRENWRLSVEGSGLWGSRETCAMEKKLEKVIDTWMQPLATMVLVLPSNETTRCRLKDPEYPSAHAFHSIGSYSGRRELLSCAPVDSLSVLTT